MWVASVPFRGSPVSLLFVLFYKKGLAHMNASTYNHCFVLGGKSKSGSGEQSKTIKVPMYIDGQGRPQKLFGGKDGELYRYYELSYE